MSSNEIKIEECNEVSFESTDNKLKIVVVGDSGVGKSNIISRFMKDKYSEETKATIGVEFLSKTFRVNGTIIKLEVWDTAGQERYKSITTSYFRGSNGAIIVFDLTRESSFENVEKWLNEIKDRSKSKVSTLLVGNKCDLKDKIAITSERGKEKARILEMPYMETSALDGTKIKDAFYLLIKQMYEQYGVKKEGNETKLNKDNITGGVNLKIEKKEKKCC